MGNPSESGAAGDVKSSRSAASSKSGKLSGATSGRLQIEACRNVTF